MTAKFLIFAVALPSLLGQATQRPVPPPLVHPDLSVTYFADVDAKDVRLADSVFSLRPPGLAFTRGPGGIWSLTTPPYEPGTHEYGLVIDGVPTGALTGNNVSDRLPRPYYPFDLLDVRGSTPLDSDVQPVPHGVVHVHTFHSALFSREMTLYIYTPPSYSDTGQPYPALYLLHGALEQSSFWTRYGFADRILDNLIARGEAREMILVMPDTGAPDGATLPLPLVERYLLEEVIPFAERAYRIDPSSQARFLAGNSAGANHARNIGFLHPETFSAIGIFSGGGLNAAAPPLETTYPKLADSAAFNAQVRYLFIALGERDESNPNILANVRRLKDSLDRLGVSSTFALTSGGHSWFNWRRYLARMVNPL